MVPTRRAAATTDPIATGKSTATGDSTIANTALEDLDRLRPLNARSVALSVLLGMHPPQLSSAKLVMIGELFDIAPNTMRTALSRAVHNGDLELRDGRYRLVGSLLERQHAQDLGRSTPGGWDGDWWTVIAIEVGRSVTERRGFRAAMVNHRLGELRPDIWMRPANVEPSLPTEAVVQTRGPILGRSEAELVGQLWNLPAFATTAEELLRRCRGQLATLDWSTREAIVPSFQLAAAILRFLRREPLLPVALQPSGWPVDELRRTYQLLEQHHQTAVRRFLATD